MPERPTPESAPRVWDAPELARVSGGSGGKKKPPGNRVGGVLAFAIFAGVFGFLWIFPTFSLVFLVGQEPIQITVTDCYNGSGKGSTGGCDGTWTLADGKGGWKSTLTVPKDASKYVSIRATARDDAGNSITQEVIRAFGLR